MLSEKFKDRFNQFISSNYTNLDFLRFVQENSEAQEILEKYDDEYYKTIRFLEEHSDNEIESILKTPHTEYYDPDYGSLDPLSGWRIPGKKDIEKDYGSYSEYLHEGDDPLTWIMRAIEEEEPEENSNQDYVDFVYEIEQDCEQLSHDIVSRLCKRAISKMNKLESYLAASLDDYPASFSFFDILSVEIQSKSYDEINPFLHDYVEDTLDNEYDSLPTLERFVLDHSECAEKLSCDIESVRSKIYNAFHEMLNQHWETKKIQNYEEKR